MKINIGYSTKSIDKAIKQIEEYQKQLNLLIPHFLQRCAEKVIELANEELDKANASVGLGSAMIAEIKNGWYAQPVSSTKKGASITIRNKTEKATYIEFGVGQIGQANPHDEASKLHYGYDINNHGNWGWSFFVHSDFLDNADIGDKYRDIETVRKDGIEIVTRGQPALMFAFQAFMNFYDNEMYVDIAKQLLKGL